MTCTQPGCQGSIVDGYCDVCGLAPVAAAGDAAAASDPSSAGARSGRSASTNRLATVPLGSARTTGSRPTRRLGGARSSRLGVGLTDIAPVPVVDPRQALMDPPVVAEEKRYCSVCNVAVGRSRDGRPGRTKGFCPKCRAPFDFDPKLQPGALLGGQYEIVGALAHGGMGWIYLARDRNVNDRWVVLKGLLNTGDPDAARAAVAEKQFLAEVEHPLIVEIYNFVTGPDGASYIVMEYVGGQSLNNLLKARMKASGGTFTPIPLDQALAYLIEIVPALSYLHGLGLLYCDLKPANIIQVGDGIKLIDLGGVRRADDDVSPIYGTVGFQAPEVPTDGCSIASDVFTVARTLAVMVFEFKGYQSQYATTLPPADEVPLFVEHDSFFRLLVKATAARPEDRFQSIDEMRDQMIGVLREVTARRSDRAVTRSIPSRLFTTPLTADDRLDWHHLPRVLVDPADPMADHIAKVTSEDPLVRFSALQQVPERSAAVWVESALAALEIGDPDRAREAVDAVLSADPWDWRGVWLQGLVALAGGHAAEAVAAFNAVYGQLPGELAPKLALARACELAGHGDVAERAYSVVARTDAAYVAPAQFGLARLAEAGGRRADALAALDRIPPTSRGFAVSRRQRAVLLASPGDPGTALADLDAAAADMVQAALEPRERAALRVRILEAALDHVRTAGPSAGRRMAGVEVAEAPLRRALEGGYRDLARLEPDPRVRVELVDRANAVRMRSLT